jgi:hypothetical protein
MMDAGLVPPAPSTDAGALRTDHVIDLRDLVGSDDFQRVYAPSGEDGRLGVPVATGMDVDGDQQIDFMRASFLASGMGGTASGIVYLLLGDGGFGLDINLQAPPQRLLKIHGGAPRESTGSEVWMDDVTGDGVGDLLIARQNFRAAAPDRRGAGALSIVVGGPWLRAFIEQAVQAGIPAEFSLAAPPESLPVFTIVGSREFGRLGIWVRSGDITGDGIADVVVGADQESDGDASRHGAAYIIRGGAHLGKTEVVDLAGFGSTTLEGNIARIRPPLGADNFHFGATLQVADLDRNGRAEVICSAALVRSGAGTVPDGASGSDVSARGGAPGGRVYVAWDDNFTGDAWTPGFQFRLAAPAKVTVITSGNKDGRKNSQLGEELIAGKDYDGNGRSDLFIGDMTADVGENRAAGIGFVIFNADSLRDLPSLNVTKPTAETPITAITGRIAGSILSDTAVHGDFDGDGIDDLAVIAPNDTAGDRIQAGVAYVLWGNTQRFPEVISLAELPSQSVVQVTRILGAAGGKAGDAGDMLGYSAGVADIDKDGRVDFLFNEMAGNGISADTRDAGNFVLLSGRAVAMDRPDCAGGRADTKFDRCGVCGGSDVGADVPQGCVSFQQQVQPILFGNCTPCHGASGGLTLFSYELLMAGSSKHGPVIRPGRPEASLLIQLLNGPWTGPGGVVIPAMPPSLPLSAEDVARLRTWVAEGAREN